MAGGLAWVAICSKWGGMNNPQRPPVLDEMFLVEVDEPASGTRVKTFSISNTPTMLLSFAANRFMEDASRYFKDNFDLESVDWRMLFLVALKPGITAAEASKTIGVDKGTVSRCVARLLQNGLISTGELHANGRSRGLFLTAAGLVMHDRIREHALAKQAELLTDFDANDVNVFCDLLRRLSRNLEAVSRPEDRKRP